MDLASNFKLLLRILLSFFWDYSIGDYGADPSKIACNHHFIFEFIIKRRFLNALYNFGHFSLNTIKEREYISLLYEKSKAYALTPFQVNYRSTLILIAWNLIGYFAYYLYQDACHVLSHPHRYEGLHVRKYCHSVLSIHADLPHFHSSLISQVVY